MRHTAIRTAMQYGEIQDSGVNQARGKISGLVLSADATSTQELVTY